MYVLEWLVCLGNSPSLFSRPRAVSSDHRGNMNMYTALRWSHHNITWIFIYLHADWCSVKICVSEGCWMKIHASFVSKMVLITTPSVNSLDCDDFIIYVAFPQGPLDAPLPNADCRNGDPKCQVGGKRSRIYLHKSNYRGDIENNPNPPQYCCKLICYRTPAPP